MVLDYFRLYIVLLFFILDFVFFVKIRFCYFVKILFLFYTEKQTPALNRRETPFSLL